MIMAELSDELNELLDSSIDSLRQLEHIAAARNVRKKLSKYREKIFGPELVPVKVVLMVQFTSLIDAEAVGGPDVAHSVAVHLQTILNELDWTTITGDGKLMVTNELISYE
jgi:hypothetical protein